MDTATIITSPEQLRDFIKENFRSTAEFARWLSEKCGVPVHAELIRKHVRGQENENGRGMREPTKALYSLAARVYQATETPK